MSCGEIQAKLEAFLSGDLGGRQASAVRLHLASCSACQARLSLLDRVELVPALDETILPSDRLRDEFHERLEAHRQARARRGWGWTWPSFRIFAAWPARLAAAGVLAAAICTFGIFLQMRGGGTYNPAPTDMEIAIGENLPLLQDMAIIENLEMLEDFETIASLPGSPKFQ